MNTQPPEQNPNDYDDVTRLRLQLHHVEAQRDAFKKAFNTEVLKVMRASVIQATISADNEIARLASEVDGLSAQLVELDDLKAKAGQSEAENARLKAEVERLQSIHIIDSIGIEQLKAEVERLESDIKLEKENEDRLVREFQKANNEVYGLQRQVAALIDDQARLKSDTARLKNNNDYLDQKLDEEIARAASFAGEIARLRKFGTEMGKHLPDTDEANRAYIDFEAGGRS
jgi:chromosome segregation ATPase